MKRILLLLIVFSMLCACAASVSWTGLSLVDGGPNINDLGEYSFFGDIYSEKGGWGTLHSGFTGHEENGGFYLKKQDFSYELEPSVNYWILAVYGDVLSDETFHSAMQIELSSSFEDRAVGGTLVQDRNDFYLGVMIPEQGVVDPQHWYGWVHVSVNENKYMILLGYDFNLDGGPIVVGGSLPTPEPSGALLLLLGAGVLMLRRTRVCRLNAGV